MAMMGRRSARAGMTLSATELTLSFPGALRPTVTRVTLATPADAGSWPALAAALREVTPPDGGGELALALLPPLIDVRRLTLPPLAEPELLGILGRSAGKYFVSARGTQTVGILMGTGSRKGPSPVLAAAASTRLVNVINAAAREAGWTIGTVTSAEGAWAAAAVALWPSFSRRTAFVMVHEDDRTVLLELRRGQVHNVRRFRSGAADAELIADAITEGAAGSSPKVGSFGKVAGQQELARALSPRGIVVSEVPGDWAEFAEAPDVMAASFASESSGPILMSDALRAARQHRVDQVTYMVAAVAVLLFAGSAGIELWGTKHKLAAIVAQRAQLAPQVKTTLIGRTSVEEAYNRVAALNAAQHLAPQWAPVFAELSARLPQDAYLTSVHARGDTLVLDGLAVRATPAYDALEGSQRITSLRAPDPVRLSTDINGETMERFGFSATLKDTTRKAIVPPSKPGPAGAKTAQPGGAGAKPPAAKPAASGGNVP